MFASVASNGGLHQAVLTTAIPFMTEAVRAWCSSRDCRHALGARAGLARVLPLSLLLVLAWTKGKFSHQHSQVALSIKQF